HRERVLAEIVPNGGHLDRTAAQRDHARRTEHEQLVRGDRLEQPEVALALLGEDLADRHPFARLDEAIEVVEVPSEPPCDLLPQRGLARAHEADRSEEPT